MIVLLDNGHGNDTKGKRSPDGTLLEWRRTRDFSYATYILLCRQGVNCKLIVPEDRDISLQERVRRVNAYGNDAILVSFHINAAGDGSRWYNANYWSAYTSKGKTKADDLATYLYLSALSHFRGMNISKDERDGDPDFEENYYILKNTKCPAVLTENFFMDNRAGCSWLKTPHALRDIAEMHAEGIIKYLQFINKY